MFLISCYRFSVHFQFYFSVFTGFLILKMPFSVFQASILRFKCHKVSCNVSRLENCGDESTPSQHKYRKNFKLNNRAISDFPDTRHIFKPLLNAVLYFHELKKISATFIRNVWFGFQFSAKFFAENCL